MIIMVRRKRIVKRKKRQRGGALFRRKPCLVDKIAEGMSMVLSGPALTFATIGAKLAGPALKRITDNVTSASWIESHVTHDGAVGKITRLL